MSSDHIDKIEFVVPKLSSAAKSLSTVAKIASPSLEEDAKRAVAQVMELIPRAVSVLNTVGIDPDEVKKKSGHIGSLQRMQLRLERAEAEVIWHEMRNILYEIYDIALNVVGENIHDIDDYDAAEPAFLLLAEAETENGGLFYESGGLPCIDHEAAECDPKARKLVADAERVIEDIRCLISYNREGN